MKLNVLKLKEIMDNQSVNQTQLGEKLRVHRATISIWFKKPDRLKLDTITNIANALEIDPKELIGY